MKTNLISKVAAGALIFAFGFIGLQAQSKTSADIQKVKDELVAATTPIYAFDKLKQENEANIKAEMKKLVEELRTSLAAKLNTISELTPEDRENVMTNFGPFAKDFLVECEAVVKRGLEPEAWVANSLHKRFDEDFTDEQLIQLNNFLKGPNGKLLVSMLKEEVAAQTEGRESSAEEMLDEDNAEDMLAFFQSDAGKAFLGIFDEKFESLLIGNVEAWTKDMLADIETEMMDGKLAAMLQKFMVDNKLGKPQN